MRISPAALLRFIFASLVFTVLSSPAIAAEPPPFKLPQNDGEVWVRRIETAIGRKNWSVKLQGNEIVVRRSELVAMSQVLPNAPPESKPRPNGEKAIRLVLRFAPAMSIAEYERLDAINRASSREFDRLHDKVGLSCKFNEFIAKTAEEKERVRRFEAEVAKLPRHVLPDLYSPNHAIYLRHWRDGFSYPSDPDQADECKDVQECLLRLFGMYNTEAAANRQEVGTYLPEEKR